MAGRWALIAVVIALALIGFLMPADVNAKEIAPGPDGDTDEGLLDYIRSTADTGFHYSGSAKMGNDDMSVVGPKLRVRGVDKLRVIDASIIPIMVSGNIAAAVIMIGEKGADLVKEG